MSVRCLKLIVPLICGLFGFSFLLFVFLGRRDIESHFVERWLQPQCAHWSILRTCQFFGIPTEPGEIQRRLPYYPKGHTMAQVAETLFGLGIEAEGFRDNWDSLASIKFPCIVHLKNPDHYIVVSGIEPQNGYIHIYDDNGSRTRIKREEFEKRWSGLTLHLSRIDLHKSSDDRNAPIIAFSHLLLDMGDIPATGEPTEFVFPICNEGTSDLVIEDVKVNCSCLKSEKPDAPIPPGGMESIRLFYTIQPKKGVFSETAAVKTNDPKYPVVVLTATGFTGVEVRVTPPSVQLDKLCAGFSTKAYCIIRYTGQWSEFDFEIESSDIQNATLISNNIIALDEFDFQTPGVNFSPKISDTAKKYNRVLELTFKSDASNLSRVEGNIKLKTNIPGYERFIIPISGTITSAIGAYPSIIDFNVTKQQIVTFVSKTHEPFVIRSVDGQNEFLEFQYDSSQYDLSQTLMCSLKDDQQGSFLEKQIYVQLQFESGHGINVPLTFLSLE